MENQVNAQVEAVVVNGRSSDEAIKAVIKAHCKRNAKTQEIRDLLKAKGIHLTTYRVNKVLGRIAKVPSQVGDADNLTPKKAVLLEVVRNSVLGALPYADQYLLNLIGECRTAKGAVQRVADEV